MYGQEIEREGTFEERTRQRKALQQLCTDLLAHNLIGTDFEDELSTLNDCSSKTRHKSRFSFASRTTLWESSTPTSWAKCSLPLV